MTRPTPALRLRATRHIEPPPKVVSANWLAENVTMPEGTETGGQPFSLASFPHVDGVLAAFDNPNVRTIVLQWGTRLGKTTTCLSLMAQQAGTNPRNMMFASSTKDAASRVVGSRLYPILAATDGVETQLLKEHRRSLLHVKMEACRIFVGWSGSETSLADVGAYFGVANEIDKWDGTASDEADSLALFLNRFKGFTDHKIILESTPTIKGRSRIESWIGRSNQHFRFVPCPLCGEFQMLIKGKDEIPGGIKWDRDENGDSNAEIAFRTAYYQCVACEGRIENYHRVPMLRRGVWAPDGCTVNRDGQIVGTAINAGSDVVGFGPLPSWYALTETWGSFARAWIRAKKRPRDLQDVVNSYMAETWETRQKRTAPEIVGKRITGQTPAGTVPVGGLFLTVSVDRQKSEGGFNVWVVLAHGADERVWQVDHGLAKTLDDLWGDDEHPGPMRKLYPHADGGTGLVPCLNGVDSGWDTKATYDFANAHPSVLALKGSTTDLGGKPYDLKTLGERTRTEAEGQALLHVNTDFWETSLQWRLDNTLAGEAGSLTLAAGSDRDVEFLSQLCNAMLAPDKTDTRGESKLFWVKREESKPNDFRDAIRYGICLGRVWTDAEGLPPRHAPAKQPQVKQSVGFVREPQAASKGGWIRRRSQ